MGRRNVALVVLDTVRKDVFDRHATRLQALADVDVAECRAASVWSTPSHASMLTGELPHRHGAHTHNVDFSGIDRADTFLADLPDHAALGVSANVQASSAFGFADCFDEFTDVNPDARFSEGLDPAAFYRSDDRTGAALYAGFLQAALSHERPLASLANGALAQLDSLTKRGPTPALFDNGARVVARDAGRTVDRTEEPFVLFANFMDAHVPLRPTYGFDGDLHDAPPRWHSAELAKWEINLDGLEPEHERDLYHYRDLYGAAVDYLDRRVADLVTDLRARTDRETTVVITADHGENLGYPDEDGLVDHKSSVSEGLLHVPLCVVNPPDGFERVARDADGYLSHLALGDVLAAFARDEVPSPFTDRAVAEVVGVGTTVGPLDEPGREDEYEHWDRLIRCAYDDGEKYVWDSRDASERYALDGGPCSQTLRSDDAAVPGWATRRFDGTASEAKAAARGDGDDGLESTVDDDTRDRLAELGYL
ncbi:sulfatase-like hydrolase/transferase [Halosimplex sp. TS25]|uniref:sulfatase-like hydrolase/transferase n=1 Tax=Halosimplex rarum TaxID=3396619 RepID=UPI0039E8BBB8